MLIINYRHYCEQQWSKEVARYQWALGCIIYLPGGLAKTTQLLLRDRTLRTGELDALTCHLVCSHPLSYKLAPSFPMT